MDIQKCVVVFSGPPVTGKGRLAEKVTSRIKNLNWMDVDEARQRLHPDPKNLLPNAEERLVMIASYNELCEFAWEKLRDGLPVLITGTFSRAEFKMSLLWLHRCCVAQGIRFFVFQCTAPDVEIEKRIIKRQQEGGLSPIDTIEKYRWALGFFQRIGFAPVTDIDTSLDESVDWVISVLS